jgi:hypothetical protein
MDVKEFPILDTELSSDLNAFRDLLSLYQTPRIQECERNNEILVAIQNHTTINE